MFQNIGIKHDLRGRKIWNQFENVQRNCKKILNQFENVQRNYKSTTILTTEISSLRRSLKTCCTIFFQHFIDLWILALIDKGLRNPDISS